MSVPWPPCEELKEVYKIDLDICEIAADLWKKEGKQLALSTFGDAGLGLDLMIEAASEVSRRRVKDPGNKIQNLRAYLKTAFTNLVRKESKKRNLFVPIVEEPDEDHPKGNVPIVDPRADVDIYLKEIKRMMALVDKRLPEVFEYRAAGFTYEEIAPLFKMDSDYLRSWFSRKMTEVKKMLE